MVSDNKQIAEAFIELLGVLRLLRAPGGCSWDQEQTSESLIPYLLEETYEIIEAIEENDIETLKEELGDLTLHILFQAELARESGQFNMVDSLKYISKKLIIGAVSTLKKNKFNNFKIITVPGTFEIPFIISNLIVDLGYRFIDPRIKY